MDYVRLTFAVILVLVGSYALWLVTFRWDQTRRDDPSLQRLSGVFGPAIAKAIAIVFSFGFTLLGAALLFKELVH
jgi:hypothetical protein